MMDCVVSAPGDHTLPEEPLAVSTTLSPVQKVVEPPAVMVGVGSGLTVTISSAEVAGHPALSTVTE